MVALISNLVLRAEDSDQPRVYFNFRAADSNPITDTHDLWGISLGMNLNRHFGVELTSDFYETTIESSGATLGEYSIATLLPQLRWRYPLFKDRFSPYLIGGAGWAFTQFNDRKEPGFGRTIDADTGSFIATMGAGFDYFIADNLSLGVDARYLYAPSTGAQIDGQSTEQDISRVLLTLGMRVYFPELRPQPLSMRVESDPLKFYFGIEFGGGVILERDAFDGVALADEAAAKGPFNQFVGARFGLDIGPHYGVEISLETFEPTLDVEGIGEIGDYDVAPILLQGRARFPLGDGRFVPYVIAGAGAAYAEFNDRKPPGEGHVVEAEGFSFAAGAGAGVAYYLASNFSVDLSVKYVYVGNQSFQIDNGEVVHGDIHTLALMLGFRVHLFGFGGD